MHWIRIIKNLISSQVIIAILYVYIYDWNKVLKISPIPCSFIVEPDSSLKVDTFQFQ